MHETSSSVGSKREVFGVSPYTSSRRVITSITFCVLAVWRAAVGIEQEYAVRMVRDASDRGCDGRRQRRTILAVVPGRPAEATSAFDRSKPQHAGRGGASNRAACWLFRSVFGDERG